jgi:5'-methylthioadenosine phosphorylase
MKESPFLAVIGGSGVYQFPALTDIETIEIDTPYGKPSSPLVVGILHGKKVAFLARHGIGHIFSPSEVNYRANIYALKMIGAHRVVSISACGSLREDYDRVISSSPISYSTSPNSFQFILCEGMVAHIAALTHIAMTSERTSSKRRTNRHPSMTQVCISPSRTQIFHQS